MPAAASVPPTPSDPGMVLAKATLQTATLLGFTGTVLGKVIGLSEASISRIGTGSDRCSPVPRKANWRRCWCGPSPRWMGWWTAIRSGVWPGSPATTRP